MGYGVGPRHKKDGPWNVVIDAGVHPEIGRSRQKWYSAWTKRDAERLLVEVLAEGLDHSEVQCPAPRQNSLPSESRRMTLR